MNRQGKKPTRRAALASLPPLAVGANLALGSTASVSQDPGKLRQSIVAWCWRSYGPKWSIEKVCEAAKAVGCASVELIPTSEWALLAKNGLTCAIASSGMGWAEGFNNPAHAEKLRASTTKAIEDAAANKVPSVIGFVGSKYRKPGNPASGEIPREDGYKHCLKSLKEMARIAEKHGVTLCIEHLNSRDDSHPMKGHPEYQGDNLDEVVALLKQVGSPRVRLLFDIYHVQIMHGDLVRRVKQIGELIGHVHTAGNPGRCEIDGNQEIHYPPVMKALWESGYRGFVGHEFLPNREPMAGLREAVEACKI